MQHKTLHRLLLLLLLPMGLVAWRLAYEPDAVSTNDKGSLFYDRPFSASFVNDGQAVLFTWQRATYSPFLGDPTCFLPKTHQIVMPLDTGVRHWITKRDFDSSGSFTWEKHPRLRQLMPNESERTFQSLYYGFHPSKTVRIYESGRFAFELKFLDSKGNGPFGKYEGVELVESHPSDPRKIESRETIAKQVTFDRVGKYFVGWSNLPVVKPRSRPQGSYSMFLRTLSSPKVDITNWICGSPPLWADDTVVTVTDDLKSTEIRRARDGSIVQRIDHGVLGSNAIISPNAIFQGEHRILYYQRGFPTPTIPKPSASTLLHDYEKNEIIAEYESWIAHHAYNCSTDRLMLIRSLDAKRLKVIDVANGETVYENDFDALGSQYCDVDRDGKQLVVARSDGTVEFIELATGLVTRQIGRQPWRNPVFYGLLVMFAIWCIAWLRTGSGTASARTFDVLVVQMAVFCYAVMDQQLAGVVNSLGRADMPLALGILSGWAFLVAIWSVWGNATRFVKIVSTTAAGVAFVMGYAQIHCVSFDLAVLHWVTLFPFAIFVSLIPAAFRRSLASKNREVKNSDPARRFQLKIVELMAITVIAAFLCVTPWRAYSIGRWTNILTVVGVWMVYCIGLGFLMLAWSRGRRGLRGKAIVVLVGLTVWGAMSFLVVTNFAPYNDPWFWPFRGAAYFHIAFTFTVITVLDIYREADWWGRFLTCQD